MHRLTSLSWLGCIAPVNYRHLTIFLSRFATDTGLRHHTWLACGVTVPGLAWMQMTCSDWYDGKELVITWGLYLSKGVVSRVDPPNKLCLLCSLGQKLFKAFLA
jgi:hypothetical protein